MISRLRSLRSRTMHPFWGIALGLCATFIFLIWRAPVAHAGTCTFTSTEATNSWHVAANWSCGGVPTSTSPVIIPVGQQVDLRLGTAATSGSITILGTFKPWGSTLNVNGSWFLHGTFTAGTSTIDFEGAASQIISGPVATDFNNITVTKSSGTVLAYKNVSIGGTLITTGGGTLNVSTSTLTITGMSNIGTGTTVTSTSGTLTFTGAATSAGSIGTISGNMLFASTVDSTDGSFSIGSGYTTTTGDVTAGTFNGNAGTLNILGAFTSTISAGHSTVKYKGSGSQILKGGTYYNIHIYTNGTASFENTITTGADAYVSVSSTISTAMRSFNITGTMTNYGTVTSTSGNFAFVGAVTNYGNIGTNSGRQNYVSTLTNSGTINFAAGKASSTGDVVNTGTINCDTSTYVLTANYSGGGAFNPGVCLVRFYDTANQSIRGLTFYNLEMRKASGTVTFNTTNATIGGTLTTLLGGTLSSAAVNLTIVGTSNIGSGTTVTSTSGTLTFTGAVTNAGSIGSSSGNKLFSANLNNTGGVLNIGSGYTTTTGISVIGTINGNAGVLAVSDLATGGTFNRQAGTVRYYAGGATILSGYTYNNLELNADDATAMTTDGNVTVNGYYKTANSLSVFNLQSNNLTVAGISTNRGTTTSTNGTLTFGSMTNYGSLGSSTGTLLFTSLANSGTVRLQTHSTSTGSVTLSGGTLYLNGNQFNVGGGWVNSGGTFTPSSGTVRFYGTGTRNIGGEASFYNLTFNNTGLATLTGNVTSTGAFRVGAGGMLAISTYRFKPAGSSYTNLGKITIGTGGKIVYALDSAQLTDNAGTHITTNTNPGIVYVKIQDKDANLDGTVADTITTTVTNDAASGADSETMTLTETGVATGIFMNTAYLPLVASASIVHNNGQFEINAGGVQTMSYTNAYDLSDTGTDTVTMTLTGTTPGGNTGTGGGGGGGGSLPTTTKYQTSTSDPDKPKNLANLASQGISLNALVKLPDDGNVNTQEDSAVYYIGADGRRHAFPNSKVFFTWYTDFGGVQVVSAAQMASIPLGKNAIYKPGIKMVKFITLPDTYLVTSGGNLRWVKTEAVAKAYYGNNWNQQIDDINDTFFSNYKIGDPINASTDVDLTGVKTSVTTISDALSL